MIMKIRQCQKKLSYSGFGVNGYRYYHSIDSLISTSTCILSCIGDSIEKTVLAHNLISISYFMKRFSLKYPNHLGPDIVAEVPSFFWGKVNIEVSFLKRGSKVFLMLFTSDTMENKFDQNLPLILLNL